MDILDKGLMQPWHTDVVCPNNACRATLRVYEAELLLVDQSGVSVVSTTPGQCPMCGAVIVIDQEVNPIPHRIMLALQGA